MSEAEVFVNVKMHQLQPPFDSKEENLQSKHFKDTIIERGFNGELQDA